MTHWCNKKTYTRVIFVPVYSSLNWWTSDECNMINGTNGAFFHPVLTKDETLYMFTSDLCRWVMQCGFLTQLGSDQHFWNDIWVLFGTLGHILTTMFYCTCLRSGTTSSEHMSQETVWLSAAHITRSWTSSDRRPHFRRWTLWHKCLRARMLGD